MKNENAQGSSGERAKAAPSKDDPLTVKEVSALTGLSAHTLRYYDAMNLFPYLSRSGGNARRFTWGDVEWVKLVACLRRTGMPVAEIARYVELCRDGDSTIPERAAIIAAQEVLVLRQLEDMKAQLATIRKKKAYYDGLLAGGQPRDVWNPELMDGKGEDGKSCLCP